MKAIAWAILLSAAGTALAVVYAMFSWPGIVGVFAVVGLAKTLAWALIKVLE